MSIDQLTAVPLAGPVHIPLHQARLIRGDGQFGTTCLYRLYNITGDLLYVGITRRSDLRERFNAHSRSKLWWLDIATVTVEWHHAEWVAPAAERLAIKRERPIHNRRSAAV